MAIKIVVTNVMVSDQTTAYHFYTEILGFQVKNDIQMGEARWLTVVSPLAPDGPELLLEPMGHGPLVEAAQAWQSALRENGIPAAMFGVDDVDAEFLVQLARERVRGRLARLEFSDGAEELGPGDAAVMALPSWVAVDLLPGLSVPQPRPASRSGRLSWLCALPSELPLPYAIRQWSSRVPSPSRIDFSLPSK